MCGMEHPLLQLIAFSCNKTLTVYEVICNFSIKMICLFICCSSLLEIFYAQVVLYIYIYGNVKLNYIFKISFCNR
jgi:hypothetical protein